MNYGHSHALKKKYAMKTMPIAQEQEKMRVPLWAKVNKIDQSLKLSTKELQQGAMLLGFAKLLLHYSFEGRVLEKNQIFSLVELNSILFLKVKKLFFKTESLS